MLKDIVSSLSISIKGTIRFVIRSILLVFFVFLLWAIAVSFFTKASYLFVPAFLAITTVCGMIIYRYFKAEGKTFIQMINKTLTKRVIKVSSIDPHKHEAITTIVNGFISSYITGNILTPTANLLTFLTASHDKVKDLQLLIQKETGINIPIEQLKNNITLQFHALNYGAFKEKVHANIPYIYIEPSSTEAEIINIYALTYYDMFGENDAFDTYMDNLLSEISITNFTPIKTLKDKIQQERRVERMKSNLDDPNFSLHNYYTIDDVDNMDGYAFETFVAALLKNVGYLCEVTPSSGDQGADVIAVKFGERTAVQCKKYTDKVGNKAVQEVVASIKYHNCDRGLVITNNYLTEPAKELARANTIDYWERDKLIDLINNYSVTKEEQIC